MKTVVKNHTIEDELTLLNSKLISIVDTQASLGLLSLNLNRLKTHFFFLLGFLFSFSLNAQVSDVQKTLRGIKLTTVDDLLKDMDFEYTNVDGLCLYKDFVGSWEPYNGNRGPCSFIESDDKQLVIAVEVYFHPKNFYAFTVEMRNHFYFRIIRDQLIDVSKKYDESYRDKFSIKDLRENVQYLPTSYAREIFNADTVIRYPLPFVEVTAFKSINKITSTETKYAHCEVLMLHKNDLGPIFFYCFYSEKGYKNREIYFGKLEKAIRFKK